MITEDQSEVSAFLGDPRTHGDGAGGVERIGPTGLYIFLGVVASVATLLAVADMHLSRCCPEGTEMAHA